MRRHHARIYRLALIHLMDTSQAADVTQEVFMRALKGFKSFLFMAEPGTWLYKTTQYVCREFNRKKQFVVDGAEERVGPSVESQYSDAQTMEMIKALIETLPAKQKEVVLLRILEELSIEETARLMRCRPGTVKAHLFKALQSLRARARLSEGDINDR